MIKRALWGVLFVCSLGYSALSFAQAADNTKTNQRDMDQEEMTAGEQGQSQSDLDMTQAIRRGVMNEPSLSMYAHNIKIITRNGMVTVKGPVTTAEDKAAIESIANTLAGPDKVQSQIDVVTK